MYDAAVTFETVTVSYIRGETYKQIVHSYNIALWVTLVHRKNASEVTSVLKVKFMVRDEIDL
jgi:hypothetical protein